MDIKDRILEMVVNAILASRLNEEDAMDNAKGDLIRRIHADRKFKKAVGMGKNTRKSALGHTGSGDREGYKAMHSDKTKKKKPLPLNIKTKSKRGAPVNPKAVRGRSVNTSRGTGKEGKKASANEKAFNKLVQGLARKEKK